MSLFDSIVLLIGAATVLLIFLHYLQIPSLIGFLLLGVLAGPHALAIVPDTHVTRELAELGVVFLLFSIGLEFSLEKLLHLRRHVFLLGGAQVVLTMSITTLIGYYLGMNGGEAVAVGAIVAMSSTAIVSKQLKEQGELETSSGLPSIAILLFQDLAVIPLLILIPKLSAANSHGLTLAMSLALLKGFAAIFSILFIGRYALKPVFYRVVKLGSIELFTLMALFISLGAAWITSRLGLSPALGAFLAGIMLGETEYRHQIEAELRPFKDIWLGLFFISVGMQVDPGMLVQHYVWIGLLLVALLLGKCLLISLLHWLLCGDRTTSLRVGVILSQGGEFGFAILTLALAYQVLPADYTQVVLSALFLSMLLAPFLIRYNSIIAQFFIKEEPVSPKSLAQETLLDNKMRETRDHVIICGYGRVGQNIAGILRQSDIEHIALDCDAQLVRMAYLAGENVFYGNASQKSLLMAAGLKNARAIVTSLHSTAQTTAIVQQVRQLNQAIPIIVRCFDEGEVDFFYSIGATEVIPEAVEASLMLVFHLLLMLNMPVSEAYQLIDNARKDRYELLNEIFQTHAEQEGGNVLAKPIVYAVTLSQQSHFLGKNLTFFNLEIAPLKVLRIRRGLARLRAPSDKIVLQAGDTLILHGTPGQIDALKSLL